MNWAMVALWWAALASSTRLRLLETGRSVGEGGNAPGAHQSYYHLRAMERILPANAYWLEALKAEMYLAGAPISITLP